MSERDEKVGLVCMWCCASEREMPCDAAPHGHHTIIDGDALLRAPVDPPERVSEQARSHHELPVIGPGSCPRCHTIVGADQVHVCANVSWRVGEASALRSEVAGAAWDLLEAIANACVESQGGVGYAAEKLRRALEDTKGGA